MDGLYPGNTTPYVCLCSWLFMCKILCYVASHTWHFLLFGATSTVNVGHLQNTWL